MKPNQIELGELYNELESHMDRLRRVPGMTAKVQLVLRPMERAMLGLTPIRWDFAETCSLETLEHLGANVALEKNMAEVRAQMQIIRDIPTPL